jgi:hypothetical protein
MQQQTEGVGGEAVTRDAVGAEGGLEVLEAVLDVAAKGVE